jgi:Mg/Co/Ni transporter MgtE
MSRKAIRKKEKIFSQENVTGFIKDKNTGKYRIVSQSVKREHFSGEIKAEPKETSETLYEISNKDDFDYKFSYIDFDGSQSEIFLKQSLEEIKE